MIDQLNIICYNNDIITVVQHTPMDLENRVLFLYSYSAVCTSGFLCSNYSIHKQNSSPIEVPYLVHFWIHILCLIPHGDWTWNLTEKIEGAIWLNRAPNLILEINWSPNCNKTDRTNLDKYTRNVQLRNYWYFYVSDVSIFTARFNKYLKLEQIIIHKIRGFINNKKI